MDLRVARVRHERAPAVRPPDRGDVRLLRVRRQEEDVPVAAGGHHDGVPRVRHDVAGDEVAGHDPDGASLVDHQVEHLGAVVQRDRAQVDLTHEGLVGADQQLLAGLAPGVEGAGHLRPTEGPVVEQPAVLTGERHTLGDALVDDVHAQLRQAVHVGLSGAVVAALDRVVEEAVHAVAVVAVVLRRVDATLRGDAVRPPWRVVVRDHLHLVAELTERRRGRRARQAAAHDDDRELATVRRVDEAHAELVRVPLVGDGAIGDLGVQARLGHRETAPVVMSNGMLTLPTMITPANAVANHRRHRL